MTVFAFIHFSFVAVSVAVSVVPVCCLASQLSLPRLAAAAALPPLAVVRQ